MKEPFEKIVGHIPEAGKRLLVYGPGNRKRQKEAIMTKILTIETDPEVAAVHYTYLKRHMAAHVISLNPCTETELRNALARNKDADAVLVNAPQGWDVAKTVLVVRETLPTTKIVVQSGRGDVLHGALVVNNVSAISKPYHMEELQELLEVVLAPDWEKEVSKDKKTH